MKKKEIITSIAIAGTIVGTAAHHKAPNYSGPIANSNNKNIKDVTLLANQAINEIGQITNTSFLHFRSGPSTNDSIISTLSSNQKMIILGKYGSWYKVNINGTIGYVYSAYINILKETNQQVGTLVNTTFLHLRSSASIYSDILETLNSNDTIVVLGQVGSWYKVKVNGQVGFVYDYYLNVANSSTNQSTTAETPTTTTTTIDSIGIGHLVNTTFLHFRTEPTVDSNIIETLYNNSDITVLAHENNGWYKIDVNGQIGYVDGSYLAIAENTPSPTKPNPAPVQKPINPPSKFIGTGSLTNTTFLHFRSEANLDSNIISTLNSNSNINVIKKVGSWYEIEVNGQIGYVYSFYLNVNTTNNNSSEPSSKGIGTATLTNTTFLHFRSEPNTNCSILETLYSNDKIIVLSNDNNGWYKIEVNGQIGYADASYLNVTLNSSKPTNTDDNSSNNEDSNIVTGEVVNSPYLHVRAGAGTNFSILEDIYLGNKVQVMKKIGSWYEIKINGKIGYVYDYYLNIVSGNLNNNTNNNNSNNTNNNSNDTEKGLVVNLNTLNVRSEPSTGSQILGTLNGGSYVNIISSKNGWYKIEYNNSIAYVSANYIQVVSPYNDSTSNDVENVTSFSGTGTVNAYLANIRAGATTNSAIIGQETLGSPITITGEKDGFYRIKLGNTYGFMTKKFITLNSSNDSNQSENDNNTTTTENDDNSSNNNQNDSTSSQITTNYPISLNDYINLEYNNWPLFSKQQFMSAINPQLIDNMFEFLSINQYRPVSLSGMNNLLQGKGVLSGQGQAFINACKKHNIDPVYFVNQSILETGYGQSRLAKGVTISQIAIQSQPIYNSQGQLTGYQMQQLPHPVTVYNLFGIGAQDNSSAFPNRALILGTTYAYTHGWTSISNAISGAADFVSSAYIHNNYYEQNTVYKLRFSPQISSIWHQYCTNIWYAKELADLIKQNSNLYLPGDHFTYDVPVFQS